MMTLFLGLGATQQSETAPGISTSHLASAGSPVAHHSLPAEWVRMVSFPWDRQGIEPCFSWALPARSHAKVKRTSRDSGI